MPARFALGGMSDSEGAQPIGPPAFSWRRLAEVLFVFLRLGCTSFGGPIAHLGYFQTEIVERRRWCSAAEMGQIIGLAQALPGPASSQTGFALGILRAGWLGGVAAWVGFTAPSAALMFGLAYGHRFLSGALAVRMLHGLQLVAVAVVGQAVLKMRRSLAPDRTRMGLALAGCGVVLLGHGGYVSLLAIALGAAGGLLLCRRTNGLEGDPSAENYHSSLSKRAGVWVAVAFVALFFLPRLPGSVAPGPLIPVFSAFYRTGGLVFGGGHVVLPLLEDSVVRPGWVSQETFLAGYGAAQALPGPLFSIGAYLGASVAGASKPLLLGFAGLVGIFLPGLLAMAAVLPFWGTLRENRLFGSALRGVNASVVGVLIAALYHPLWTDTIRSRGDFWIALAAFCLLVVWRLPSWIIVLATVAASIAGWQLS